MAQDKAERQQQKWARYIVGPLFTIVIMSIIGCEICSYLFKRNLPNLPVGSFAELPEWEDCSDGMLLSELENVLRGKGIEYSRNDGCVFFVVKERRLPWEFGSAIQFRVSIGKEGTITCIEAQRYFIAP